MGPQGGVAPVAAHTTWLTSLPAESRLHSTVLHIFCAVRGYMSVVVCTFGYLSVVLYAVQRPHLIVRRCLQHAVHDAGIQVIRNLNIRCRLLQIILAGVLDYTYA